MSRARARLALVAALVALTPAAARACAVCGIGGDPNRDSFFWSTVFLSLLPLGLMGGGILYLWKAARRAEAQQEHDTGSAPDTAIAPPTGA